MFISFLKSSAVTAFAIIALSSYAQAQGPTILSFDGFSGGTILTTQYENVGVDIVGASVLQSCASCFFPPVSGSNVAFAPSGVMTFTFNPTIIGGNVHSVSAYVSDPSGPAVISAYDATDNLLGQTQSTGSATSNQLLTLTTSGNPIAYVQIQGGPGQFTVDDFSFTWASAFTCSGAATQLTTDISGLSGTDFQDPKQAVRLTNLMQGKVSLFNHLMTTNAANQALLSALDFIQDVSDQLLPTSSKKTDILKLIQQLITAAQNGQC